jgi:hypothetical protein
VIRVLPEKDYFNVVDGARIERGENQRRRRQQRLPLADLLLQELRDSLQQPALAQD